MVSKVAADKGLQFKAESLLKQPNLANTAERGHDGRTVTQKSQDDSNDHKKLSKPQLTRQVTTVGPLGEHRNSWLFLHRQTPKLTLQPAGFLGSCCHSVISLPAPSIGIKTTYVTFLLPSKTPTSLTCLFACLLILGQSLM